MRVPEAIRNVERPANTIVVDNGKDTKTRYSVRARSGVRYVPGGNPCPENGRIIGHIIDNVFVPISLDLDDTPDMKSYGAAALAKSVADDIYQDLLAVYPAKEATGMMAIAMLKATRPRIAANRYGTHYQRTFVSVYYPGAALSKNTVSDLFARIGMNTERRLDFFSRRFLRVAESEHIAIDGTLRQDTSEVNDLSDFSYKSRLKGVKDVSVLYAYDIETMEPLCSEVFPGNYIDASSFSTFISDNGIKKGIIVADKGFPPSGIKSELKENPGLHYLIPLRRNSKVIEENGMLMFDSVVRGTDKNVAGLKKRIGDNLFLYSFRDSYLAGKEDSDYLRRSRKKDEFDSADYNGRKEHFGLVCFESDLDLSLHEVYRTYSERWLLELMFSMYKGDEELETTSAQGDFTVLGEEFVNFIATLLTSRMVARCRESGLLEKDTYKDIMDDLSSAWRKTCSQKNPESCDKYWVHTLPLVKRELELLGLSEPLIKESRGPGRPRKEIKETKPKRPVGRPRKNPVVTEN
jgi:hypothetical protein